MLNCYFLLTSQGRLQGTECIWSRSSSESQNAVLKKPMHERVKAWLKITERIKLLHGFLCSVGKDTVHSHFTEGNLCGLQLSARWIEHITAHLLYNEALSFLQGHRDINVKRESGVFRFLKITLCWPSSVMCVFSRGVLKEDLVFWGGSF